MMEAVRGAAVAGDRAALTRLLQIQPPPGHTAASVNASPGRDPVCHWISDPGPSVLGHKPLALTTSYGPQFGSPP